MIVYEVPIDTTKSFDMAKIDIKSDQAVLTEDNIFASKDDNRGVKQRNTIWFKKINIQEREREIERLQYPILILDLSFQY